VPLRELAGYQPTWARLGDRLHDELLAAMSAYDESDVEAPPASVHA
jgi:hypothetical protein